MSNTDGGARAPSKEEVRAALEKVLASQTFRVSRRLGAFLRFIVETDLAGQQSRIKSFTIAVEALGRGPNFDPQADATVRVEAARLRRTLARYYGGPGARDPVIIEIPRGRYVPVYRRRDIVPALPGTLRHRAAAMAVPVMERMAMRFEGQIRRCRAVAGLD
jgi:hypothetical protein